MKKRNSQLSYLIFPFICLVFILTVMGIAIFLMFHNMSNISSKVDLVVKNNQVQVPAPSQKAILNYKTVYIYWIISTLWSLILPGLIFFSSYSVKIRNFCERKWRSTFMIAGVYFTIYSLLDFVLSLPLTIFGSFFRSHLLGLSNQSFLSWFITLTKQLGINIVISFLIIWIPIYIVKKYKKRWWLYVGLLILPYYIFTTYLNPIVIDPMFNKFTPIQDKALESKIEKVAEKAGIGDCDIYVVDKSKETNTMNAYMTGIFNSKRIVIWDTSIKGLSEDELLTVVGHEIGHYVLGHIPKAIVLGCISIILILYFVNISIKIIMKKYGNKWGIRSLDDVAIIPIFIILLNIFMLIYSPVSNAYSRYTEKEADRFALEVTKNNIAAATTEVKFMVTNLAIPQPDFIYRFFNYDHPSIQERIDFDNQYKPWENNQPLKYGKYIK